MNNKKDSFNSDLCLARIKEIKKLIDSSTTFSLISFPGVGISVFLKYLVTQPFGRFFYIDVFGLSNLTSSELFSVLLKKLGGKTKSKIEGDLVTACKKKLELLTQKKEKVIICFGGFDKLKKHFNQDFFHHLQTLRNISRQKIIFIFGICKRIDSLISENLMDNDLFMLSSAYYLKPYSKKDLIYLLSIYGPKVNLDNKEFQEILHLSGGHFQLLQLLLRSERIQNPVSDPFIKLSLKNIYQSLTYQQKKILLKVAIEGNYNRQDDYLIKVGLVKKINVKYQLFSPLLAEFVKNQASLKLPPKEHVLFQLLRKHSGEVVPKDKIFKEVWQNSDNVTDWALDSLIFRLRRNPSFISNGYIIESYKKQGYILIKN